MRGRGSEPVNGPDEIGPRHSRRVALGAGAFGLVSLGLPSASSAASVGGQSEPVVVPDAPTGVSGTPIGYLSGSTTGSIRVSWSAVTGASTYQVGYSTSASGPFTSTVNTTGTETTLDITGLSGVATTYYFVVRTNSGGTLSADSSTANSTNVIATGGTVTSFVGNGTIGVNGTRYVVHSFTSTGTSTFALNRNMTVEHLIVGGGGSGGSRHGGGGGAGGLVTNVGSGTSRTAGNHTVYVGLGGVAASAHNQSVASSNPNWSGWDSYAFTPAVTAKGGGRGGGSNDGAGGSGGSGGASSYSSAFGSGTSGQGNNGGSGTGDPGWAGGGGGGAGAAGSSSTQYNGGAGGAGVANTITGTSVNYAGGGGGAGATSAGAGGSGGGGAGNSTGAGTSGTDNRGGGGGGAHFNSSTQVNYAGGNGGSGVVILRYAIPA